MSSSSLTDLGLNPYAPQLAWGDDETSFAGYQGLADDEQRAGQVLELVARGVGLQPVEARAEEVGPDGRLAHLTLCLSVELPSGELGHLDARKSNFRGLRGHWSFGLAETGDKLGTRIAIRAGLRPLLETVDQRNGADPGDYHWTDLAAALQRGDDRDEQALRLLAERQ